MKKVLVGFAVFVLTILVAVGYYRTRFTANNSPPAAAPADTGVTATTATQITWIPVHDQREQAFSIDVPQGWKTYGGMFRFSNSDARMVVDMTSPDGLTNIRVGDATIPPYTVPAPLTPRT